MDGLFVIFLALALAWSVQMLLAHRQARRFMRHGRELQDRGRVAIGVSSQKRLQRRTYVALAADGSVVRGACELSGQTVWAKPKPLDEFDGRRLEELSPPPERSSQRQRAAAMAARTLLGDFDDHDQDRKHEEVPLRGATPSAPKS